MEWNRQNKMIVAFVVIAVVAVVWLSWSKTKAPDATQRLIDEAKKVLVLQYQKQLNDKDSQMKAKDGKLADLQSRLLASEQKYRVLAQKITDLQKEKDDVKPPASSAELRSRFIALGLPPLPAK
jgi:hypothetical protein